MKGNQGLNLIKAILQGFVTLLGVSLLHEHGGCTKNVQMLVAHINLSFHSRKNPMGLIIALDINNEASGDLFWDDGESTGEQPPTVK